MEKDMSRPLILFHANCPDGFCAAWVAHKVFGDDADYVPVQYGEDQPAVAGRRVFILDFSYKRTAMSFAVSQAADVVVLDHHKTAQAELDGFAEECERGYGLFRPTIVFDMGKSGGRLAWEYFFPAQDSPWLVDYTEDRDLWRWNLRDSREVSAALASYPRDFGLWDGLAAEYAHIAAWPKRLADEGRAILRYQGTIIDQAVGHATEIELGGHKILAVNSTVLFSEIAGKLAEGRPFGAAWFIRSDGKRQWALRSRDGGVDVSEIAKQYGGGGHRNAAGFEGERP